jgi:glyoxylase-like metal-dependent hydrolase (beta-lactamase superfamily II)
MFTGDTLLIDGCGRTDFQGGSAADLYDSITGRLFALEDALRVWPGHDYKGQSVSSIGWEKRHNRAGGGALARAVRRADGGIESAAAEDDRCGVAGEPESGLDAPGVKRGSGRDATDPVVPAQAGIHAKVPKSEARNGSPLSRGRR